MRIMIRKEIRHWDQIVHTVEHLETYLGYNAAIITVYFLRKENFRPNHHYQKFVTVDIPVRPAVGTCFGAVP